MTCVVLAAVLGLAALGQPVLAEVVAPAEQCCSVAPRVTRTGADILGQGDEIVVIGRQADTAVASDWAGHTILDVPGDEWSIALNDEWVGAAISQRRQVYLATATDQSNLWDDVAGRSTVFGREYQMFLDAGYTRQGDYLLPPGG